MHVAPVRQRRSYSRSPPRDAGIGSPPASQEDHDAIRPLIPLGALPKPSFSSEGYKTGKRCPDAGEGDGVAATSSSSGGGGSDPVAEDLPLRRLLPSLYVVIVLSVASHSLGLTDLAEDALTASVRTVVQLSCLGAILSPLFRTTSAAPALAYVLVFMLPLAAYEASARSALTYPGAYRNVLAGLGFAVISTTAVALFGVLRPKPRLGARHLVPLAGMLLSNSLSGAALALDRILEELGGNGPGAARLEVLLAFGADPSEATFEAVKGAVSSAMVPTLNSMNVIGLVAIPGMMTGQILGGSDPTRAARYQIMIMCLIAGSVGMTSGISCWLTVRDTFDSRGVFLDEIITKQRSLRVSKLFAAGPPSWFGGPSLDDTTSPSFDGPSAVPSTVVMQPEDGASSAAQTFAEDFLFAADLRGTVKGGAQPFRASLSLPQNSIAVLMGPSGSGKTTLLKLMAELSGGGALDDYGGGGSGSSPSPTTALKDPPPAPSSIRLHGRERNSFRPNEWRRRVLYVPQGVAAGGLPGTPRELLEDVSALRAYNHGGERDWSMEESAEALLSEWGLPAAPPSSDDGSPSSASATASSFLDKSWSDLSGGESQRVLLALALSAKPDVLLLDEPTSALDEESKRLVEGSLWKITGGGGGGGSGGGGGGGGGVSGNDGDGWSCAVLMVTHDEEQARRVTGRSGAAGALGRTYRLYEERPPGAGELQN